MASAGRAVSVLWVSLCSVKDDLPCLQFVYFSGECCMSYFSGPGEGQLRQPSRQLEQPTSLPSTPNQKTLQEEAISASTAPGQSALVYPSLVGLFFIVFLCYLLYEQTRPDLMQQANAPLRCASDLFVAFGSAIAMVGCFYTAWKLRGISTRFPLLMANRSWIAWSCLGAAAC